MVLLKRPYLKKEWCFRVLDNPLRSEPQENNRYRFWGEIPELEGRYLRVVTLKDKVTHPQRVSRSAIQTVKLSYFPETDSLYIDLSEESSVETREISEGVQLDYDAKGNLVGIDIDNASSKVELKELVLSRLPGKVRTLAA